MYKKLLPALIIICSLFILSGCGSGGSPAPAGSTITISPPTASYVGISGDTPVNFTVTVKTANGVPLNNVDLFISGGFAEPRVPARYQFYSKRNTDGPVSSGFTGRTDNEGAYEFSIRIYGTVLGVATVFSDSIQVQSATVSGSATVEVTAAE